MQQKQIKCRASAAGKLLEDPRSSSDGVLSASAKNYIREIWIEDNYSRTKDLSTLAIQKGLQVEEDGITMLNLALRIFETIEKNDKRYEDENFSGTPDIIIGDTVYDIKSNWDIFTFAKCCADKLDRDYQAQLNVYMHLTGLRKAALVYCLIDTPQNLIDIEISRINYKLNDLSMVQETIDSVTKNLTYKDIPVSQRIKIIPVEYDEKLIEKIIGKIPAFREHYSSLKLGA